MSHSTYKPLPIDTPLACLLSTHDDPRHGGFFTLVDSSSLSRKRFVVISLPYFCCLTDISNFRIVFSMTFILNICVLALMTWLAFMIVMRDILTPFEVVPITAFYLTQDLVTVWAIYSLLVNTTIPFFFGECILRLRRGFRPIEVIFLSLPMELSDGIHFEQYQCLAACAIPSLTCSSFRSSLIGNVTCVIPYSAIHDAYSLIDSGKIGVSQLDSIVWRRENGAWIGCEICKGEGKV